MDAKLVDLLNNVIRDPLCPRFCHLCPRVWQISSSRGCRMHCFFVHIQWKRKGEPCPEFSPLLLSDWLHAYGRNSNSHQSLPRTDQIDQNLLCNWDLIPLKRGHLEEQWMLKKMGSVNFSGERGENGYVSCRQPLLSTISKFCVCPVSVLLS